MMRINAVLFTVLLVTAAPFANAQESAESPGIDQYSFRLGAAAAFSEMVSFGNKKLALSSAVSPEEMAVLEDGLRRVIMEQGVMGTLMLIYRTEAVLTEYRALKAEKAALVEAGEYTGQARTDIAWRFGRMLSYPDATIEEKIRSNSKTNPPE
jgi:hypothetical protein